MTRHTTSIEWMVDLADAIGADATVLGYQEGCAEANRDCQFCWAKKEVHIRGHQVSPAMQMRFAGLTRKICDRIQWTGEIRFFPNKLVEALDRRRSAVIFPASRSDVFQEHADKTAAVSLLALAALRPDHRFVFPTKRWARAVDVLTDPGTRDAVLDRGHAMTATRSPGSAKAKTDLAGMKWPLPNLLVGASVGAQDLADKALPQMRALAESGWHTWASSEPRRGPIDWQGWQFLDWLVVGCESGPKALIRIMDMAWARADREWAHAAGVPFYFKQAVIDGAVIGRPMLDGYRHLDLPKGWRDSMFGQSAA